MVLRWYRWNGWNIQYPCGFAAPNRVEHLVEQVEHRLQSNNGRPSPELRGYLGAVALRCAAKAANVPSG